MAFGKKATVEAVPETPEQIAQRRTALAVTELARACKAGRLEAETRHATVATAAAALVLVYEQQQTNDLLRQLLNKGAS